MVRGTFAAVCSLFLAGTAIAQNCDVGFPNVSASCQAPSGNGSSVCTLSLTNKGTAPCTGNYGAALGVLDPGTTAGVSGTSVFSTCTFAGTIPLPFGPFNNYTSLNSTWVCGGSSLTLQPNETATISGTVTPPPGFNGVSFAMAMTASFRNTAPPPVLGTVSMDAFKPQFISFTTCSTTPVVAGSAPSGLPYVVSWSPTTGAPSNGGYEIQEATKSDFSDAISVNEPSATSHNFQHTVATPTVFFYRVRPVSCSGSPGTFAGVAQITVLPQLGPTSRDFDLIVPLGTTAPVSQDVTFSGLPPGASFSVTTDQSYLTVTPSSGNVRSDGTVTVTVKASPSGLPVGANTGTVIVTLSGGKRAIVPNDSRSSSTTVSISLVTPVTSSPKGAPPDDAVIVPAIAHLEGIVPFRSDIRITNAGTAPATYLLTFTPSNTDGTTAGKQTTISVDAGQTVALNDVLKDFFGFALPTDTAGGVLEIRSVGGSMANTFVSSRTYAATANGTYGQFIPAVPLSKFLKAGAGSLTLTQVSQSAAFRTNIGLVEGLGVNVSGRLRVFDPVGQSLGEFPFSLRPFEFQQLGSFLAGKGITAPDARIEAVVDSGSGSISTYASVLDQKTQDPLLVSPIQVANLSANRYVLPGMADVTSQFSNFHSDIRIYNASPSPVTATATFYPQGNGTAVPKSITINASEIKAYNNVLPALFGVTGTGGAIVVTTPANVPLIVSGRTYSNDAASGGTFGQFIPAVTPADGVGVNDPPLEVLQLEQSANFRSNLGLCELTGNPVTVLVSAILPGSKVVASAPIPLQPNEFRQLGNVLSSLNAGNTYNARITVKVTDGTGRVTAYGSVVDNLTSDPTYVPAQK